jgi:hypothetical protein
MGPISTYKGLREVYELIKAMHRQEGSGGEGGPLPIEEISRYFDESKTDMPTYDDWLKGGEGAREYVRKNKGKEFDVESMSPFKYIYEAMKNRSSRDLALDKFRKYNRGLSGEKERLDPALIEKYKKMMREGVKFSMPVIDFTTKNQEGAHRVFAAKELGEKNIPVMLIREALKKAEK